MRENLSELRLIIIDEMSLVSSDMLYKIDAKLKEIFHLRKELPFAGVGIVLVGDLLQIPPVKAKYIFLPPKNERSVVLHNLVEYEGKCVNIMQKNQKPNSRYFQNNCGS